MELDELLASDFSGHLEETFRIHLEGREPLEVELVEVQGLVAPDDEASRRRPFSVVFRGPGDAPLEQSIYAVEHEALGELHIFLVTIGHDREGRLRHEAVFT